MITSARALLDGLNAAGVTLLARSGGLFARPAERVSDEHRQLLARFKPELVRAFGHAHRERLDPAIEACPRCDLEFKSRTVALCPWCTVTESQFLQPNGCAETLYLNSQSAPERSVQDCPNVEKETVSGHLDSLDSETTNRYADARTRRITGTSVQTVQPSKIGAAA